MERNSLKSDIDLINNAHEILEIDRFEPYNYPPLTYDQISAEFDYSGRRDDYFPVMIKHLYKYNLVTTNEVSLGRIHQSDFRTNIHFIGRSYDKGRVWITTGAEISDLVAAGLVYPRRKRHPLRDY